MKRSRYISLMMLLLFVVALCGRAFAWHMCDCDKHVHRHVCCHCDAHHDECANHTESFHALSCLFHSIDNPLFISTSTDNKSSRSGVVAIPLLWWCGGAISALDFTIDGDIVALRSEGDYWLSSPILSDSPLRAPPVLV